jgi:hypothetical protein
VRREPRTGFVDLYRELTLFGAMPALQVYPSSTHTALRISDISAAPQASSRSPGVHSTSDRLHHASPPLQSKAISRENAIPLRGSAPGFLPFVHIDFELELVAMAYLLPGQRVGPLFQARDLRPARLVNHLGAPGQ